MRCVMCLVVDWALMWTHKLCYSRKQSMMGNFALQKLPPLMCSMLWNLGSSRFCDLPPSEGQNWYQRIWNRHRSSLGVKAEFNGVEDEVRVGWHYDIDVPELELCCSKVETKWRGQWYYDACKTYEGYDTTICCVRTNPLNKRIEQEELIIVDWRPKVCCYGGLRSKWLIIVVLGQW